LDSRAPCCIGQSGRQQEQSQVNAQARIETEDSWSVAGKTFRSRLIVGTGKYKDFAQNAAAVEASGAQIVTVAVRC
jgi:thiazole synthase